MITCGGRRSEFGFQGAAAPTSGTLDPHGGARRATPLSVWHYGPTLLENSAFPYWSARTSERPARPRDSLSVSPGQQGERHQDASRDGPEDPRQSGDPLTCGRSTYGEPRDVKFGEQGPLFRRRISAPGQQYLAGSSARHFRRPRESRNPQIWAGLRCRRAAIQ